MLLCGQDCSLQTGCELIGTNAIVGFIFIKMDLNISLQSDTG